MTTPSNVYCKQCSETIPDNRHGRSWCSQRCYGRWHYLNNREKYIAKAAAAKAPCIDCGTPRRKDSKGGRCNPCAGKARRGVHLKNGKAITGGGYVLLTGKHGHPNAYKNGTVLEHVYVMSQHLGRPIRQGENIHHINGDKADNRLENLELWSTSQPKGQRVADKVAWAREILAMYADEVTRTTVHSRTGIVRAL